MKREILFKGKRVDNGEWVEGDLIRYNDGTIYIRQFQLYLLIQINPETVCQFTGLLDKNGRNIFEGDIVQYSENPFNTVKVVWNNRTKGFVLDKPNYKTKFTRISGLGKLLVRSNIHD